MAIRQCATNDGAMLRNLLENLPDAGAPRLVAVRDPARAARILNELFDDIEDTMNAMLEKHKAALRQRPKAGGDAD